MQRNFTRACKISFISLMMAVVAFCSLSPLSFAADRYWTNSLGGNFTNKTLWMTGIVPTNNDNAFFTNDTSRTITFTVNDTNASAFFNSTALITNSFSIGSSTWWITNSFILGQNTANTAAVNITSGTLIVTNNVGTGTIVIGGAGYGQLNVVGGTVIADHIYQTNAPGKSQLTIESGGTVTILGDSVFTNTVASGADIVVGSNSVGGAGLNFQGGVSKLTGDLVIGAMNGADTNEVTISGRTIVSNMSDVYVGVLGDRNELWITNGATLYTGGNLNLSQISGTSNNLYVIGSTGIIGGSLVSGFVTGMYNNIYISNNSYVEANIFEVGKTVGAFSNTMVVSSGSHLKINSGNNFIGRNSSNNVVIVTGAGTLLDSVGAITLGENTQGRSALFWISDGAGVSSSTLRVGVDARLSALVIQDPGSYYTNTANVIMGSNNVSDSIAISNGGALYADNYYLGANVNGTGGKVLVDGNGSILSAVQTISIGSNALATTGKAFMLITRGGTLEANSITNGYSGFGDITNLGGVYQFTRAGMNIGTNAGGFIILTNGTISFRNIDNAPIIYSNDLRLITFQGSNSFMLNAATNAILSSYTFTNGMGATNYNQLVLMNAGSLWQATNTLVGSGSSILFTNTTAATFGTITNSGAIQVAGPATTVTNLGSVALNGTGNGGEGSLVNISGTNIFDGPVRLAANSSIGTLDDQLTMRGTLTNNAFLLSVTNAANTTLMMSNLISGTGGISHSGAGTLSLASSNSFSGNITNISGTISIDQTYALSGVTGSTVLNGGTLLFNVSATNTTAGIVLNGGIIQETDTNISLGALTISANSTIQLGSGGGIGRVRFASGTNTVGSGAKLTIYGWSWNSALSGGNDDLIFFTSTTFETASFLNNVTFFGTGGGARVLTSGELVPITPEPTSMLIGSTLLALIANKLRRRASNTRPP